MIEYTEEWAPSEYVLVNEGVYSANIYEVEKIGDANKPAYGITFRINGGEFDGQDVKSGFVGLYGRAIFRLHQILTAAGVVDTYYDKEAQRWKGLPEIHELEGLALYINVEHDEFQSSDKQSREPQFNDDGSPRLLKSARASAFASLQEPKPELVTGLLQKRTFDDRATYLSKQPGYSGPPAGAQGAPVGHGTPSGPPAGAVNPNQPVW